MIAVDSNVLAYAHREDSDWPPHFEKCFNVETILNLMASRDEAPFTLRNSQPELRRLTFKT